MAPPSARGTRCRCRRSPATAPAWSRITISPRRCMPPTSKRRIKSGAPPASARSNGSIRARWRRGACRWCSIGGFPARWSITSPAPPMALRWRARRAFLRERLGQRIFAPGIDIVDDPLRHRGQRSRELRRRGRRHAHAQTGRGRRAQNLAARLRHRARTRHENHRHMRSAAFRRSLARPEQSLSRARRKKPGELIAEIEDGFYVTDLIGSGANMVTGRL